MRAYVAVLAVVASLALAGCSSSQPDTAVDPEEAETSDYVVPAITYGVVVIVGLTLVGVGLLVRHRRRGRLPGTGHDKATPRGQDKP